MGDDSYNPFTAETHVKRVSLWKAAATGALLILGIIAGGWCAAVLVLSLERVS